MAMQLQVLGHKLDVTKTRNGERGAGKRKIGPKQRTGKGITDRVQVRVCFHCLFSLLQACSLIPVLVPSAIWLVQRNVDNSLKRELPFSLNKK